MSHPAVQSTVVKVQRKVPYWVHTEISCAQPLAHGGRWKGLPSWLFGKYSRTLILCNFLEANVHNVFQGFLYFILSVSCVCHHQQTSAEIPISQQACGLGIKRSRSKKIHSSINVAKDCLLTGQEQACSRITCLFGCLVVIVRHHAENG